MRAPSIMGVEGALRGGGSGCGRCTKEEDDRAGPMCRREGAAGPAGWLRPSGGAGKVAQREGRRERVAAHRKLGGWVRPGWEGGQGACWAGSRWPGPVGPN
jgi:hypothetical protein